MNNVKNTIKARFTASCHTHVMSLNDAYINPDALCVRINELGGKGCVITDHGVLSAIEDFRHVFEKYSLKLIPGCELYVDGGILGRLHLVVIAKNDNGYKGVSKIVTESNYTLDGDFPVIKQERLLDILREFKGDIFVLTACMQGILSAVFLQNQIITEKIDKLVKKQSAYIAPDAPQVFQTEENVKAAESEVERISLLRDETKRLAEQKFVKREKSIEKMEKAGTDVTDEKKELELDKQKAEKAKQMLESVQNELKTAKDTLSNANKLWKEMQKRVEKYMAYEDDIRLLKHDIKSDEELRETAKTTAKMYQEAAGKNRVLAEIQFHGIPQEKICYPKVIEVAKELGMPLIATNDVHILTNSSDDRLLRQILRSMRFGDGFEEEYVGDSELYLKDNYELYDALVQIVSPDDAVAAINNIDVLFDACNVEFKTDKHYPKYKE